MGSWLSPRHPARAESPPHPAAALVGRQPASRACTHQKHGLCALQIVLPSAQEAAQVVPVCSRGCGCGWAKGCGDRPARGPLGVAAAAAQHTLQPLDRSRGRWAHTIALLLPAYTQQPFAKAGAGAAAGQLTKQGLERAARGLLQLLAELDQKDLLRTGSRGMVPTVTR